MNCHYCNSPLKKTVGEINRAKKTGANLYCDRKCSGLGRRSELSDIQKKQLKSDYDKVYREKNAEKIKIRKHEYFVKTYDPEKSAIDRKKRMPKHVEYCRRPEYKKYKKEYDRKHRSKKRYGEFWESHLIIQEITTLYDNFKIKQENQLINKSQKRKRLWKLKTKLQNYLQRI